jgi:small subunit ribosomal protein S1
MLERRFVPLAEREIPITDEGWWAAILADENSNPSQQGDLPPRSSGINGTTVNWQHIREIHLNDGIVHLVVQSYNRGGLLVQGDDIQGFVPVSHLLDIPNTISEDERSRLLIDYIGRKLKLKIIECDPRQERVVLSERAALAGEGQRKHLLENLKSGDVVAGDVTNVTDFGVFVDLGGVEGLIHVSELSWGRVQHPHDILQVGQTIKTLVMQVCEESARVALSYKRLFPNPWDQLLGHYKIDDIVSAKVTSVVHFGAFACLEDGVEGLIHISSICEGENPPNSTLHLHKGELITVRILHIDVARRRLGLALAKTE